MGGAFTYKETPEFTTSLLGFAIKDMVLWNCAIFFLNWKKCCSLWIKFLTNLPFWAPVQNVSSAWGFPSSGFSFCWITGINNCQLGNAWFQQGFHPVLKWIFTGATTEMGTNPSLCLDLNLLHQKSPRPHF